MHFEFTFPELSVALTLAIDLAFEIVEAIKTEVNPKSKSRELSDSEYFNPSSIFAETILAP